MGVSSGLELLTLPHGHQLRLDLLERYKHVFPLMCAFMHPTVPSPLMQLLIIFALLFFSSVLCSYLCQISHHVYFILSLCSTSVYVSDLGINNHFLFLKFA